MSSSLPSLGGELRLRDFLLDVLKRRIAPEARAWLEQALAATAPPVDPERLGGCYAQASRRVGKEALSLDGHEREKLLQLNPMISLDGWGADEAARAGLLLSLSGLAPDENRAMVLRCYEQGDSREQASWLRSLSLLPGCERFLDIATDACRTNIQPLFEAIACENPYPALYFPQLNINQMVLKSLFSGIALSRILRLETRLNPELATIADDYVSEREAAGRSVPSDIWLVLAPKIGSGGLARVHGYLEHEDPEHRYWAAVGLGLNGSSVNREVLLAARERERESTILQAINISLDQIRVVDEGVAS